jgi:hypothetical protein
MGEFTTSTNITEHNVRRRGGRVLLAAATALLGAACGSPDLSGDATPTASATPGADTGVGGPRASKTRFSVVEHVDNHAGAQVFGSPEGAAAPEGDPASLPYGTAVNVACYTDNLSGMTSINAMYKLVGGQLDGDYVAANIMDNGAGMGPNPVSLDPRVPRC